MKSQLSKNNSSQNPLSMPLDEDLDLTEIINGEITMGPSPFGKHQNISGNLYYVIRQYIEKYKLGRLYYSPLDVILEEGINRLQPDLLFIKKDNVNIDQDWIRGVPDMVCEIVSTGSVVKDTITKKDIYERYKVQEYWIVIPELKTIEVLCLDGDKYKLFSIAEGTGFIQSKIIEGLCIDINDIFDNIY
ncbi:MAG: Uma2 family endonuclease [Candidatus Magnetoovum sp. WYHC-5]|nr:Uma2 family endonuclease [Candidatus Magnetoovum sp. WYHC-5]